MKKESERYPNYSNSAVDNGLALRSISNRGTWGELNATKDEISRIKEILKENGIVTQTVTESFANEESFKALSGKSPDIIHLATHGYYISSRKKASVSSFLSQITPYSEKERYMQWSGLLMAGANNAWNGKFTLENVEDGILTADEISRLDLSKTQLVVLSACETAKGVIDPVDGVYGLQQAFKKVGVGTIVMSLWKIPDEATSLLMNSFYAALISGNEKHNALKKAMQEAQLKYKDPYYWAGFIILD
jgi:CHAT domain-containing protein